LDQKDSFALAVKLSDGSLGNFMIENSNEGWVIRGTTHSFPTLTALIDYYCLALRISLGIKLIKTHDLRDPGEPHSHAWLPLASDPNPTSRPPGKKTSSSIITAPPPKSQRPKRRETEGVSLSSDSEDDSAAIGAAPVLGEDDIAFDEDGLPISSSQQASSTHKSSRMNRRMEIETQQWAHQSPAEQPPSLTATKVDTVKPPVSNNSKPLKPALKSSTNKSPLDMFMPANEVHQADKTQLSPPDRLAAAESEFDIARQLYLDAITRVKKAEAELTEARKALNLQVYYSRIVFGNQFRLSFYL
jgi:hypothetical protein